MDSGIRTLTSLALLTRIAIGLFIGSSLGIALLYLFVVLYDGPAYLADELWFSLVSIGVSLTQFGSFLASIVLVAIWLHRAHSNLHEAGLDGLNYGPVWATASFFIPFVNLWVPFASTRELYNRSTGKSDWHAASSAGDVASWYACNWGALVVLAGIGIVAALEMTPGVYVLMPPIAAVGLVVLLAIFVLGSAWFLMEVIRKVSRAQADFQHVSQSDVFD